MRPKPCSMFNRVQFQCVPTRFFALYLLADGRIRESVTFAELAEFVWFMETGSGSERGALATRFRDGAKGMNPVAIAPGSDFSPLLGIQGDRAVFLLYNGILKDKSDIGGNVLNGRTLEYLDTLLPDFEGERVVYGARLRFDKTKLAKMGDRKSVV